MVPKSPDFLHDILSALSDGFLVLNDDDRCVFANAAAGALAARPAHKLIGRSGAAFFKHALGGPLRADVVRARRYNSPVRGVQRFRGSMWLEYRIYPGPQGTAVLLADATERMAREDRLRQEAEAAAEVYDGSPCAFYSLDRGGLFTRVNGTALTWFGREREDLLHLKTFSQLLSRESRDRFHVHFEQLLAGQAAHGFEVELVHKNGRRIPMLMSMTPVGRGAELRGAHCTLLDHTSHRQSDEARLGRLQDEVKREFAKQISHEFRTPVAAIRMSTETLLTRSITNSKERLKLVDVAERNVRRLGQMVEDLLALAASAPVRPVLTASPLESRPADRRPEPASAGGRSRKGARSSSSRRPS